MEIYKEIKKTTWRGAKVRKIIKFLERYQYIVGQPNFPIRDISNELYYEKRTMEVSYYGTNLAIEVVISYIKKVFEREKYSKREFKNKIFSGAKVVSLLEFLDFKIYNAKENIEQLQSKHNKLLSISENREIFLKYWEAQLETLLKMKKWILFGITQVKQEIDEEDDWIESVIYEADSDD
ncbi:hypothetical protein [Bacillus sp. B-jedd]|uniref:hypothetical protein n=1 Tax=Bacillus sp. B-jedd TaxID=1476857 RepID=UPI0005155D88|nr:hypothetical protein [Bacillus sp. B-jedd]CEG25677.1 hypothetical protein BN1002_00493 [Bacillus sp. B-jedd]